MGGYGSVRIGLKHPDIFGSLYIMSPCCLSPRPGTSNNTAADKAAEDAKAFEATVAALNSPKDAADLPFYARAQLATAAAWSPNPQHPPLYFDLPTKDGAPQPEVVAKWAANAPLAFVDQYIDNLRRYAAVAMDVGDQDTLRFDAGRLHDSFDSYGVSNSFEIYHGTHTSAVADRIQNHVIPFFSQHLCDAKDCK
jgi:S-formylglutathione hydrolase FrmB